MPESSVALRSLIVAPYAMNRTLIVLLSLTIPLDGAEPNHLQQRKDGRDGYREFVRRHLDFVTERSRDRYGTAHTNMWLATIDTSTGGLPKQQLPRQLRWYRRITSPHGSNLYWDQPTIVAAYELSRLTGDQRYATRADEYIRDFLSSCVSQESGLFQWGNHIYYDVLSDDIHSFSGGYHECRPHTPAWETFWRQDPKATEQAIRAMGLAHIKDRKTGRFCRHANPSVAAGTFQEGEVDSAKPFLEAGASLIDSLCWLADKTDDRNGELTDLALRVARYSFSHRDESTRLVRNQPVDKRWDYYASTTEVGLWAGSLLRATEFTGEREFQQIAEAAIRSWLRFGFDETAGKYYGRLAVASGLPQPSDNPRGWVPPNYAEVFDIHERPTHNYPLPMAEVCLTLNEKTRAHIFLRAVDRWVQHITAALPANGGRGAYAEDYGRVIHFLMRASLSLDRPEYKKLAQRVADEAVDRLFIEKHGVFRSHPREERCDAVDGPGILLLAFLYLESEQLSPTAFAF